MVLNGKKLMGWIVVVLVLLLAGSYWFLSNSTGDSVPAGGRDNDVKTFDLVAVEHTGKHPQTGEQMEIYRWDPGLLVVNKGDRVRLNIIGLNGHSHPFTIEGMGVKGEVVKGDVTTVEFVAKKAGTFKIVCLSHTDLSNEGPMIGHIVVLK
ncbi:heme/copper-type cytochrome/quinol oxidase subunit 2 [Caldalkalibacillus uzonensis]|uniref:Heme/copper-type cytochrome/quinol oxidase subunit 2 n=1 Tax=Caldalkalibacillus uzonensis TaxID=353224 RepID=A0ABU0CWK3_9BACI|nr:cupredoxin domain-containing protein [Caldalkalibacillus uzonensis]MDQ0339422.1 heme/copper-type cytochrome/quinol oxidase subunit 2 [Caldalkalibacillus uzonensis]